MFAVSEISLPLFAISLSLLSNFSLLNISFSGGHL